MSYHEAWFKPDKRKKAFVALRIDDQLFQILRQKALQEELSLSQVMRRILRRGVEDVADPKLAQEKRSIVA